MAEVSGTELETAVLKRAQQEYIPVPRSHEASEDYYRTFFDSTSVYVKVTRGAGTIFNQMEFPSARVADDINQHSNRQVVNGHRLQVRNTVMRYLDMERSKDTTPEMISVLWPSKVFYFAPQRHAAGLCSFSRQTQLDETASNLASVLSWMRGEQDDVFQKVVNDMREIFDTIGNISITNTDHGFEVRIWPTRSMNNPDASYSLSDTGTGLGQALSILVAASTTKQSLILIDEINTFLHPGAAKSLLRILQSDYAGHQYLVSTHSAEIIGTGLASSISFITKNGDQSEIKQISPDKIEELSTVSRSLGISASDVFMFQNVVWVEGPTEESCFDLIRRHRSPETRQKVRFLAVSATGDFFSKKRDRELVLDIYKKLTSTMSPITPKPLFCFDREDLSDTYVQDIRRRAQYQIHFLTRRNIESFLIDPEIVSILFTRDYANITKAHDRSFISSEISRLAASNKYKSGKSWAGDHSDKDWLAVVDGASLLSDLFDQISDNQVSFNKTRDSVGLLAIALEVGSPSIDDLITTVSELEDKSIKQEK